MNGAELVSRAIDATKVAEVVKVQETDKQLRITHRVAKGHLRVWLDIVTDVLNRKKGWDAHVSKQYFLKNGRLIYAWNFIAQWGEVEDKEEVLKQIATLISRARVKAPSTGHKLSSYPLMASDKRNAPQAQRMDVRQPGPMSGGLSQKGAYVVGGGGK